MSPLEVLVFPLQIAPLFCVSSPKIQKPGTPHFTKKIYIYIWNALYAKQTQLNIQNLLWGWLTLEADRQQYFSSGKYHCLIYHHNTNYQMVTQDTAYIYIHINIHMYIHIYIPSHIYNIYIHIHTLMKNDRKTWWTWGLEIPTLSLWKIVIIYML